MSKYHSDHYIERSVYNLIETIKDCQELIVALVYSKQQGKAEFLTFINMYTCS